MKTCSFVPSATQMIYDMGLQDLLQGVTFECPSDKPKVVRSILEGHNYTSAEIDRIVSEYSSAGKSLYFVDMDLLKSIAPDLVFTQSVCDVCQIGTSYVERAIGSLEKFPEVVPLIPRSLDDVFENAKQIASSLGQLEVGVKYVSSLEERLNCVIDKLRLNRAPLRRVMIMEWMAPIYNCGHWIPYQIAIAGGVDMLSNPSGYSIVTDWSKIVQYNPEVLVLAPCGYDVDRAIKDVPRLTSLAGWHDLEAVVNNEVYLADADMFTQPSASTVVDGIEILAAIFHPTIFKVPNHLSNKLKRLSNAEQRAKQAIR